MFIFLLQIIIIKIHRLKINNKINEQNTIVGLIFNSRAIIFFSMKNLGENNIFQKYKEHIFLIFLYQ